MTSLRRLPAIGALLALLATGCAQTFDATNLGVPATLASAAGETPVGQAFAVKTHTVHAFWGLVPLKKARLDRALANQLVGGKAVANLTIKTKSRWSDILLTGLTLGLIAPKTVVYEGIVVGR
ncbi:MAG: hypothetical protein AB7S39_06285 [Gemmatimonadales bacterium]